MCDTGVWGRKKWKPSVKKIRSEGWKTGRLRKQVKVWQEVRRKCSCWRREPVQNVSYPHPTPLPQISNVPLHKALSQMCVCVSLCFNAYDHVCLHLRPSRCLGGQARWRWKTKWARTPPHSCLVIYLCLLGPLSPSRLPLFARCTTHFRLLSTCALPLS